MGLARRAAIFYGQRHSARVFAFRHIMCVSLVGKAFSWLQSLPHGCSHADIGFLGSAVRLRNIFCAWQSHRYFPSSGCQYPDGEAPRHFSCHLIKDGRKLNSWLHCCRLRFGKTSTLDSACASRPARLSGCMEQTSDSKAFKVDPRNHFADPHESV